MTATYVMGDPLIAAQFIRTTMVIDQVFEVRVIGANGNPRHIWSGFFQFNGHNETEIAESILRQAPLASGIYVTVNPVRPECQAIANQVIKPLGSGMATSDARILNYSYLFIDFDAEREAGISATENQKQAAVNQAYRVFQHLKTAEHWPDPLIVDSGNGVHCWYRVDLPTSDAGLIAQVLEALSFRFDEPGAKVDTVVGNPSRVARLPGTMARKGDEVPQLGIIHRQSQILYAPKNLALVSREQLLKVAEMCPSKAAVQEAQPAEWFEAWRKTYLPNLGAPTKTTSNYTLWRLDCPWHSAHARDAYLMEYVGGGIAAGCHHASCSSNDWPALRQLLEPGYSSAQNLPPKPLGSPGEWGEPEPLILDDNYPLPPIDWAMIPRWARAFILDVAELMQAPLEYLLAPLFGLVAGMVGRKACIRPKRFDTTWIEILVIWAASIGAASTLKSPTEQRLFSPLEDLERKAHKAYESELQKWQKSNAKAMKNKEKLADKLANGDTLTAAEQQELQAAEAELEAAEANKPVCRRLLVSNATMAALQLILAENPQGVLLRRDELSGFLAHLQSRDAQEERAFILEAFNGKNYHPFDRIGRGSIIAETLCLSIFGGIQPVRLRQLVLNDIGNGGTDGLLPRFGVLLLGTPPPKWQYVDRAHDAAAAERYQAFIENLAAWTPAAEAEAMGYELTGDGIPAFRFAPAAQQVFIDWYKGLHRLLPQVEKEHSALAEHFGKYRGLMPKLALLLHIIEFEAQNVPAQIGLKTTLQAAAWVEHLAFHARAIYLGRQDRHNAEPIKALLEKIRQNKIIDGMSISEILRKDWSGLKDEAAIRSALEILEEHGWLRLTDAAPGRKGGRPTQRLAINPHAPALLAQRGVAGCISEPSPEERARRLADLPRPWLDRLRDISVAQPMAITRDILDLPEEDWPLAA